ncbi:MAG: WYL domain-containing protein [Phycisphaerae bacterium]
MKLTRAHRLIRMVQILQAGRRCSVQDLADEMSVSRRTIFRDMEVLRGAGIHCTHDADTESYRIDKSHFLRPLMLSVEEALALMLVTRKLMDQRVVPFVGLAVSAGLKIESALPADIRDHCSSLLAGVQVGELRVSDVDAVTDILLHIEEAIGARRKIRIMYDSYYEKAEIATVLRPYCVTFRSRGWYVIGHSEKHRQVRTFKLERVTDLEVLEARFKPARDFSLEEYYGNAWHMIRGDQAHHVEIQFSSKVAGNVEEVAWHRTQRTRRRSNGTLIFEVDVDGLEEISWWVLGYGDQAVVNEPEALRQLLASHARNLVQYYETKEAAPTARA